MNFIKNMALVMVPALTACASSQISSPRIDYINQNAELIQAYTSEHSAALSDLSIKVNEECYFKQMHKRKNMTPEKITKMAIQGIVVYELESDGTVIDTFYESNDNSQFKRECIDEVAIGTKLPKPGTLKYVYSKFSMTIS